jgi:hypothetical protein
MHKHDAGLQIPMSIPEERFYSSQGGDITHRFPRLFYNSELEAQISEERSVSRKHLINTLNYINFQDGTILLTFKHRKYEKIISFDVRPMHINENSLDCEWLETEPPAVNLASYQFQYLLISDGLKLILAKPEIRSATDEEISFILPETSYEVGFRKIRRHPCEMVSAELTQNGVMLGGTLTDFNVIAFRVDVSAQSRQSLQWVNSKFPMNVILRNEDDILYSGYCRIIRQSFSAKGNFVLEPLNNQGQRFMPREYRTLRQKISPSPSIIFRHPFTGRTITLKVYDLSSSGFSVEENEDSSVLLVGMIVPELEIVFADSFKIKCKAQVLYRNAFKDRMGKDFVKCGLVILVMVISDHTRLSAVLLQARDERSYLCNRLDLDSLWSFLFETGFIYPEKYASILGNKDKLKGSFEKLYLQDSDIARHFIYQEKGQIYGHMSMLRFYENSWLIHHHAARKSGHLGAGIEVLRQIGYYVNDFYSKYSDQMNFVICYFRTENKFPNRVFGGFERDAKDPKVCSIDQFAYLIHQKCHIEKGLPDSWTLTEPEPEDFFELKSFYEHEAGGLMLDALDLEPGTRSNDLDKEYLRLGLKRSRHLFSLKKRGSIKAVFMVNVSDIGLNLSDLTNCIHALVIDSDDLPKDIFYSCLSLLYKYYEQEEIPVLVYPVRYAVDRSISYDKVYNLWVLSNQYLDSYFKHIENLFSRLRQPKEPQSFSRIGIIK